MALAVLTITSGQTANGGAAVQKYYGETGVSRREHILCGKLHLFVAGPCDQAPPEACGARDRVPQERLRGQLTMRHHPPHALCMRSPELRHLGGRTPWDIATLVLWDCQNHSTSRATGIRPANKVCSQLYSPGAGSTNCGYGRHRSRVSFRTVDIRALEFEVLVSPRSFGVRRPDYRNYLAPRHLRVLHAPCH